MSLKEFLFLSILWSCQVFAKPVSRSSEKPGKECTNIGDRRVDFDKRCLRDSTLYGCNAGGQGIGCRFCGFSIYPACPDDVEEYQVENTTYTLFENDIMLVNRTVDEFLSKFIDLSRGQNDQDTAFGLGEEDGVNQYNAVRDRKYIWSNARVPFRLSNRYDLGERNTILAAMSAIENQTCLRFVPRTGEEHYLYIHRGDGCSSSIGRLGGPQGLSLGNYCINRGTAIHELMHAIGFYHEQSRADRDQYVVIHWNNIRQGREGNFRKYTLAEIDHLGESYDYDSIMHYSPTEFSKDYVSPTITPRQPNIQLKHASLKRAPSETDVVKINKLYGCYDYTTTTVAFPTTTVSPGGPWHRTTSTINRATTTTPPTPTTTPTTSATPAGCTDLDRLCAGWAEYGYCQRQNNYVQTNCRLSCGKCAPEN